MQRLDRAGPNPSGITVLFLLLSFPRLLVSGVPRQHSVQTPAACGLHLREDPQALEILRHRVLGNVPKI